MPKRRDSLADLHRTAVGQGQALLGTVPAEAPRALVGSTPMASASTPTPRWPTSANACSSRPATGVSGYRTSA